MKKGLLFIVAVVASATALRAQTSCSGAYAFGAAPPIGTQSCLNSITINDATMSTMAPATACGTPNREFWMSFTVSGATAHSFIFDMTDGTGSNNVGFQILSNTSTCNTTNWAGTILDCDNDAGNNAPETETLYNLPNGTYYIRLLSYSGNINGVSMCLTGIADPPANDNPCAAINVPVGANGICSPVTASNVGATATSGPANPTCSNYAGGDVWYSVTVPASGNITFATDYASPATITDNGIAVYSGTCGSLTQIGCDDDSGNGLMASLSLSGLTPGATLYVRVWEYGNDVQGTFTLCFSEPNPSDVNQDCNTANQLCSDATLSGASNGGGAVTDLSAANQDCLSTEHQANWYFMVVTTAGTLEFTISPANGSDDYDFGVWRYVNGVGQSCPPGGPPVRCSFGAGSGLNGSYDTGLGQGATDLTETAAGDNWVQGLTCAVGDVIVLLVDNFSATTSPFSLDFTGNVGLSCVPTSLPVTLLGINGIRENGYNKISWKTQAEINTDHYRVEELVDGVWTVLTTEASKSGENTNDYVVYDGDFDRMATSYYRLVLVDIDGQETLLGVVSVQADTDFSDVVLAPNPAKDHLTISLNALKDTECELTVLDMSGKVVAVKTVGSQQGSNTFSMDVTALQQGSYMMVVRTENTTYRKAFMK